MKKLFTLLTLLVAIVTGANADEAILSWYMGADGAAATGANSITGASGCAAEDFTIAITSNTGKSWSNGNGDITYNNTTYKTLKNSNGAQNTITCPSGKVATKVKFLVTTNADSSGKLSEIDGTSCDDVVTSTQNYSNPTEITKDINNKSSFTFTFSTKQVCFIAIVTYTDAPQDIVANPAISMTGNNVSITCDTQGASIYYTTNGTEPTTSSTLYSKAITLDNSCTIRAKAFNGANNQYSSEIVKRECYVTHPSALAILGYNGGTVAGDVWTSNNGDFILTNNVEKRGINYADLAGSQDGFKLNHTDSYTLKVSEDIKVTKLVVVGKSWLQGDEGNASTIAFDDFTPASITFYEYPTGGETYVKTAEFTPSSELDYGASITMRPGNNQLGAYIEVYGVKRSGPANPEAVSADPITWDFTNLTAQSFTENSTYSFKATDGTTEMRYSAGSSDAIIAKDGNNDGYLKENGKTSTSDNVKDIDGQTVVGKTRLIRLYVSGKGKLTINCGSNIGVYTVKDGATSGTTLIDSYTANTQSSEITVSNFLWIETTTKGYINTIVWTPSSDAITLTTTTNMAGWRAFYDADNSYNVDENTTVFVAASEPENGTISLTSIEGIPAGVPVILHTTSSADSYKMTLTKATVDGYDGTNKLQYTKSAVSDVYRLGYNASDGVGFYPYSGTPTSGAVILNVSSANAGSAKALTFSFGDVTGISNAAAAEAANAGTGKMYNLSGQIVGEGYKGIVIVNGKKVIK